MSDLILVGCHWKSLIDWLLRQRNQAWKVTLLAETMVGTTAEEDIVVERGCHCGGEASGSA